jgi:hypothetical protein
MKGNVATQGEIIAKQEKYTEILKKISRSSRPISIKLNTNHSWVKGIQVCSIKGQVLFKEEIITKNVKMGWGHLKIFF